MAKRMGLGRGLSNLIPGAESQGGSIQISENPDYQEIPIHEIDPNPNQPRKRFSNDELQELAETIKNVGIIEPVVVRKLGQRFQLISGERRWRAASLAGFKNVPAVIKNVDDLGALEMGIIENVQREELSAIEEARAYELWMNQTGLKPADIAQRVGKDRSTITNLIRLLKLPAEVQSKIELKQITSGQARPLIGIADKRLLSKLVERITQEGWSARRVEEEVGRLTESPDTSEKPKSSAAGAADANIRVFEDRLRARFKARVAIQHKKNGSGKIVIHYANLDELDRILT